MPILQALCLLPKVSTPSITVPSPQRSAALSITVPSPQRSAAPSITVPSPQRSAPRASLCPPHKGQHPEHHCALPPKGQHPEHHCALPTKVSTPSITVPSPQRSPQMSLSSAARGSNTDVAGLSVGEWPGWQLWGEGQDGAQQRPHLPSGGSGAGVAPQRLPKSRACILCSRHGAQGPWVTGRSVSHSHCPIQGLLDLQRPDLGTDWGRTRPLCTPQDLCGGRPLPSTWGVTMHLIHCLSVSLSLCLSLSHCV
nr:unnamed protein product [Homo sapiens]